MATQRAAIVSILHPWPKSDDIYIYTDALAVLLVHVGLAQARPNYIYNTILLYCTILLYYTYKQKLYIQE